LFGFAQSGFRILDIFVIGVAFRAQLLFGPLGDCAQLLLELFDLFGKLAVRFRDSGFLFLA
jgi:hypothetical protein